MNPYTHQNPENGYNDCKCSECGIVAKCTPDFDFYVRIENEDTKLLTCESCVMKPFRARPILQMTPDGEVYTTNGLS